MTSRALAGLCLAATLVTGCALGAAAPGDRDTAEALTREEVREVSAEVEARLLEEPDVVEAQVASVAATPLETAEMSVAIRLQDVDEPDEERLIALGDLAAEELWHSDLPGLASISISIRYRDDAVPVAFEELIGVDGALRPADLEARYGPRG